MRRPTELRRSGWAESLRPDVVLIDIRMPRGRLHRGNAPDRERLPGCHILVLTTFSADRLVYNAQVDGAGGFLLKNSSCEHLIYAVRPVAAGGLDVLVKWGADAQRRYSVTVVSQQIKGEDLSRPATDKAGSA